MKLENKITFQFIVILFVIGGILLIASLTLSPFLIFFVRAFLNVPIGSLGILTYFLYLLPLLGVFLLSGLYLGHKIKKPLFYLIHWIENLSEGIFEKPDNIEAKKINFRPFLELEEKLKGLTSQLLSTERKRTELEESRRNWTRGVTHDLKTPLSYIKGYATLLRSKHHWDKKEIIEFAQIIEEKSLHMEQLIHDLGAVYAFQESQVPLDVSKMKLVPFIEDVLADLWKHPIAKEYHLQFNNPSNQEIELAFDQKLLKRAFENLLMNAVHHNPAGTVITVTVGAQEKSTFIEVKDDGIGMDEQTVKQLFDRHYRGTPTDQSDLGSGLGMLLAKQFIERLHGHIQVESEPHHGTTITIFFPNN